MGGLKFVVESSSSLRKPSGLVRVPPLDPLLPDPEASFPLDEPEFEPVPF